MVTPNSKKNRITSYHSPKQRQKTNTRIQLKAKRKSTSQSSPKINSIPSSNKNLKNLIELNINKPSLFNEYEYTKIQSLLSNALWNNKVSQHDIEEFGREQDWFIIKDITGNEPSQSQSQSFVNHPSIMCMIGGYQKNSSKLLVSGTYIEYLVHIKLYENMNISYSNLESGKKNSINSNQQHAVCDNSNNSNNLIGSLMVLRRYSAFEDLKMSILQLLQLYEYKYEDEPACSYDTLQEQDKLFEKRIKELFPEKHSSSSSSRLMQFQLKNSIVSYFFSDSNSNSNACESNSNSESESECVNDSDELFLIKRQCRLQYWLNFILFYLTNQYQYYQRQHQNKEIFVAITNLNKLRHLLVMFLSTP